MSSVCVSSQVKENFDRFISCKNTIDDIHTRLRKAEKAETAERERDDDDSGDSTADVVESVAEVSNNAHAGQPVQQWDLGCKQKCGSERLIKSQLRWPAYICQAFAPLPITAAHLSDASWFFMSCF